MTLLAGDVGGTHTRLAFFTVQDVDLKLIVDATFPSRNYPNLEELVHTFVTSHQQPIDQACFGIAGPVQHERSEAMQQGDPAAAVSAVALAGTCGLCAQALDLFVSLYGAEAGNLALKLMATRGIYVGGGIALKILGKLQDATFMEAFVAKGRMRPLLEQIPVCVMLNDKTALLGAARYAALRASSPDTRLSPGMS